MFDRLYDYRDLVDKYGLELVAGNFLKMPYSGLSTNRMICRFAVQAVHISSVVP